MEIYLVNELTKTQVDHLFHWRDRVFPVEGKDIQWAKSKWHLLAFDGSNEPSAHLGYADFMISFDDHSQEKIVGVGGVVVRPEFQGQNIPEKLFSYLHNSNHARSLSSIFTLFCPKRLESYYQKHGYRTFQGQFTFLQNGLSVSTDKFILMRYGSHLSSKNIHINSEPW